MTRDELKACIEADKSRYVENNNWIGKYTNAGFQISKRYRKCQYWKSKQIRLFSVIARYKYRRICTKYACGIPSSVQIDSGLAIFHPYSIVINSHTVIGKNCTLHSGVVIGMKNSGDRPVIGDNVFIGTGAIIIGNVHIGDNAVIGAGAIVVKDVPANAVVVNDPAHIIKFNK